jgi:uncharacterized damage-inducible protein DinB
MELKDAIIESWDRQCRIVRGVAELINDSNRDAKPSQDGWPIFFHLAHIQKVRKFHLYHLDPLRADALGELFRNGWDDPIDDLDSIRKMLAESDLAVREVVLASLEAGKEQVGGYNHPVFFLQHMIWHEGWHIGLIFLALRLAGQEPPEEWEESHVWSEWRSQ